MLSYQPHLWVPLWCRRGGSYLGGFASRRGPYGEGLEPGWFAVSNGDWVRYRFEQVHEWRWLLRDSYVSGYQGPHGPVHIQYNADRSRTRLAGASVPTASIVWGPRQLWPDERGRGRYGFPVVRSWTINGDIGGSPIEVSQSKFGGDAEQRSLQVASAIGDWSMRPSHSGSLWRVYGEQLTSGGRGRRTMNPSVTPDEVAVVCLLTASHLVFLVHKEWLP